MAGFQPNIICISSLFFIAYTLIVTAVALEACAKNPGFQIMTLRCTGNQRIYISSVSVGNGWQHCDSHYCIYEALNRTHVYFQRLTDSCDGETSCQISATELANISKVEPHIFLKCGNHTPLYNERNKVLVDYTCSDTPITATPPIPLPDTTDAEGSITEPSSGTNPTAAGSSLPPTSAPPNPTLSSTQLTTDPDAGVSHSGQTAGKGDNSTILIAIPIAAVGVLTILVIVILVVFHRRRMCFWAEKNKSLAGIKPAGGDNNNMERKHSPPNYDTVDDQYHVLDESATYYNSDVSLSLTSAAAQQKKSESNQDNLYSLPSSHSDAASPLQSQLTADQSAADQNPGLSNMSYTDHCVMSTAANTDRGGNSEYSIAEEVMPSNHRPTKHPPVYQEVNKNRNPNKKNQLAAQGDRGYINHPLNGTAGSSFDEDQPEMIDNDIYEGTTSDDEEDLPVRSGGSRGVTHKSSTASSTNQVTELVENDLYGTD